MDPLGIELGISTMPMIIYFLKYYSAMPTYNIQGAIEKLSHTTHLKPTHYAQLSNFLNTQHKYYIIQCEGRF
jgi:hypothetical protein